MTIDKVKLPSRGFPRSTGAGNRKFASPGAKLANPALAISGLATLVLGTFCSAALAEESKPMTYNDGVFCHAVYSLAMDAEEILDNPIGDYYHGLETYQERAGLDAIALGAKEGKSEDDVGYDIQSATRELRGQIMVNELTFETNDVYRRVCDDIVDNYQP